MAWWSKVVKKVKDVAKKVVTTAKTAYKKADVRARGRLPGGITQAEVEKKTRAEPSKVRVTESQAKRIREGTLKATPETTRAVKAGTIKIKEERPLTKVKKALGIESLTGQHYIAAIGGAISTVGMVKSATAVSKLSRVGGTGLVQTTISGDPGFAVNTATTAVTTSWLSKLAVAVKNPTVVVGALMTAIGSYPFAGFIQEEALQTAGFGVRSAINNNDLEGAEAALEIQRDMLDPDMWSQIKAKIPFVNILDKLDKFYEAAQIKVAIDGKIVEDLKTQQETGETEDAKWKRLRQEQADQDKAAIDYYNQQRKLLLQWEEEAADRDMKEDAAFWAKEREKQRKAEAEDRQAIADFWQAYRKEMQKYNESLRPSNLKFGLL